MRESQTPGRSWNPGRSSEQANHRSKETSSKKIVKQITKKNLSSTFSCVSEETCDPCMEFIDFSSISDATQDDDVSEMSIQTFLHPKTPSLTSLATDSTPSSSLTFAVGFTPTSKINTEIETIGGTNVKSFSSFNLNVPQITSTEAEAAAKLLLEAQSEVMKSTDVAAEYKKILDAVINTAVELHALPPERDRLSEILSMKTQVLFVFLLLWLIAVLGAFFFCSGQQSTYSGPLPT